MLESWQNGQIYFQQCRGKNKKIFRELLYKGQILHFNFYEDNLSEEGFKETFNEVVKLIEEAKKVVYSNVG